MCWCLSIIELKNARWNIKKNGTKCLKNLSFRGKKNINERAKPKTFDLPCITLCKQIFGFIKVKMGFQDT